MKRILLAALAVLCLSAAAYADGYDLTVKSVTELPTQAADPASGDYIVRYDASADEFVKVDASTANAAPSAVDIDSGTIDGATVGASSASTGAFTTLSASSTISLSSAAVLSPTFNPGVDVDTLTAGAIFFNSADNKIWFCSAGGCDSIFDAQ